LLKKYPESVKLVFKNFPLARHAFSEKAAVAALAAGRQRKFWEYHDELFKDYRRINDQRFSEVARKLALDESRFEKDRKDPSILAKVRKDYQEAVSLGVRGIPTIFINGRQLKNRGPEAFEAAIEKELLKIKSGHKDK
jgi:protein-disulfide isomerase